SFDGGFTWHIAHTFPAGAIRHVHNIVYDPWQACLWILTGDYGRECKIIRASADLRSLDDVVAGNQQCRTVAALPSADGVYFATDTPLEQNYICLLDRAGRIHRLEPIASSSIYACRNRSGMFFSTMVEPSNVNRTRCVSLIGSCDGSEWEQFASWQKDSWPMRFFQFGNAFFQDGNKSTELLTVMSLAVRGADRVTRIWRTVAS